MHSGQQQNLEVYIQLHPDVVYNCLLTKENPFLILRKPIMLENRPTNMMLKAFYTSVV